MNRLRLRKASVLRQYLLSYFGIALLSCCLIGALFSQSMARQLLTIQLELQQNKLDQVVEDFQIQMDLLKDISHQVSIGQEFRPAYFRANKYNEIQLLQSLSKFVNHSPFASNHFLYYYDTDVFYQSTGRSSNASYFVTQNLGMEPSDLLPQLQAGEEIRVLGQQEQGWILLLYPIRINTARQDSSNAVLCFILTEEEMEKRITTVTGGLEGPLHIQFDNSTLLRQEAPETGGKLHDLESASSDGDIHGSVRVHLNALTGGRGLARIMNIAAFLLAVMLLLIASSLFAWKSYLPIRHIHEHVTGQMDEADAPNELAGIEEAFDSLRQTNREVNQALLDQFVLLRTQLLRGVLNGDDVAGNLVRLGLLGVELAGPFYMALYLCLNGPHNEALETIEGLSKETLRFFAVRIDAGNGYAVICSMEEEYLATEAEELLRDALETRSESGEIGRGKVYASSDQIPTSYLEAASDLRRWKESSGIGSGEYGTRMYDPVHLLRLLHEVRSGNTDALPSGLDALERHLDACAPSLLAQKYVYSQAISQLVQTVGDWGVPMAPSMLSNILTARDNRAFREGLCKILFTLAETRSLQRCGEDDLSVRVLEYLKAHYLDYDLSLDRMAEEFHVTANYLSKLIKNTTSVTYKAYVTSLKIEEAKRLLEHGLSVAETGNRLGYSNASHFIRTFRQSVDVTPSVYQKQHRSGG